MPVTSAVPKLAQDLLAQLRQKKKPGENDERPGVAAVFKRHRNILIGAGVGVVVLIVVIVAIAVGVSSGGASKATGPCSVPAKISSTQKQASLYAHNKFRSMLAKEGAANLRRLKWNDKLAARAQDWVNLCVWGHTLVTTCDESERVGQNLYRQWGGLADTEVTDSLYKWNVVNATAAIHAWYVEKDFYSYADSTCMPGQQCGHYTQVVWAETTEVGCAVGYCPRIKDLKTGTYTENQRTYICDYYPSGNVVGYKPYIVGAACSQCASVVPPDGGWMCIDRLCEPCTPAEHGPDCVCEPKDCLNGASFDATRCICRCAPHFWGINCELKCECINQVGYACEGFKKDGSCTDPYYMNFLREKCPVSCNLCDRPATCFDDE